MTAACLEALKAGESLQARRLAGGLWQWAGAWVERLLRGTTVCVPSFPPTPAPAESVQERVAALTGEDNAYPAP